MSAVKRLKQEIREGWRLVEGRALFPRPAYGRIPNSVGAELACRNLARTEYFAEGRGRSRLIPTRRRDLAEKSRWSLAGPS